jgi:hypothetical protein
MISAGLRCISTERFLATAASKRAGEPHDVLLRSADCFFETGFSLPYALIGAAMLAAPSK